MTTWHRFALQVLGGALFCLGTASLGHAEEEDDPRLPAIVLPHGPDAPVQRMSKRFVDAYNHDTLTGVWTSRRPDVAPDQALATLGMLERFFDHDPAVTLTQLRASIVAAQQHQATDAMVLYAQARFLEMSQADRINLMLRAAGALDHSPYPPMRAAVAWMHELEMIQRVDDPVDATITDQAIRHLVAWLKSLPEDDRGAISAIDDLFSRAFLHERVLDHGAGDRLLAALADPAVPRWWSEVLRGRAHITLAWLARGSGWANSVTPQGWAGFANHLAQARQLLVDAWDRHHDRPMPAVAMITVAMGGATQSGDCLTWFEKAVTAQLDVRAAYDTYNNAILPRWGGSYEAMLALGDVAAATKRYDTEVPWRLVLQVENIWQDAHSLHEGRPPILDDHVYGRCVAVMDGYLATANPATRVNVAWYYASLRAVLAYMCGANAICLREIDAAHGALEPSVMRQVGMDAAQLRAAALAAETPVVPEPAPLIPAAPPVPAVPSPPVM